LSRRFNLPSENRRSPGPWAGTSARLIAGRTAQFILPESMIKSKFIRDILDLLSDGDSFGQSVREQINYLTEKSYNYTGVGLFVDFSHDPGIEKLKTNNEKLILNGVIIRSKEIELGAEATVFCDNGLIDYLEIWSHDGVYPKKELETYTLTQEWTGSPGRKIVVD